MQLQELAGNEVSPRAEAAAAAKPGGPQHRKLDDIFRPAGAPPPPAKPAAKPSPVTPKAARAAKEMASLAPWGWDAKVELHPPGSAARRDFQEVQAARTTPSKYSSVQMVAKKQRAEAAAKPAPKPAAKPAPKPAAKPAPKPAPTPAPKPAPKPVPKAPKPRAPAATAKELERAAKGAKVGGGPTRRSPRKAPAAPPAPKPKRVRSILDGPPPQLAKLQARKKAALKEAKKAASAHKGILKPPAAAAGPRLAPPALPRPAAAPKPATARKTVTFLSPEKARGGGHLQVQGLKRKRTAAAAAGAYLLVPEKSGRGGRPGEGEGPELAAAAEEEADVDAGEAADAATGPKRRRTFPPAVREAGIVLPPKFQFKVPWLLTALYRGCALLKQQDRAEGWQY